MSYLALYRRFRPTGFDKLIGQDTVVKTLINQIEGDKIGHAYLFCGARGTGKTSCAKIFARAVNCLHPEKGSPCGKCEACLNLSAPNNIDILEIDAASNNKVEEIREIREKIQYPPVHGRYKVYIVDEVHMLTDSAFNALLKTLEEPPKHALFILATTEPHKMPATVLSRCMRFDFKLIPTGVIAALIGDIYREVGKEYDDEAIFQIAKAGEGSVRDALSIADICLSYSSSKLTYADVLEVLGATNRENIYALCESLLAGEAGKALSLIDELVSSGKSVKVLVKDIILQLRDLLIAKTCVSAREILSLPQSEYEPLKARAQIAHESRMLRLIDIFSEMENALRYGSNPRVLLESAALKGARAENDYDLNSMLYRLNVLESKISNTDISAEHTTKTYTESTKLQSEKVSNTDISAEHTTKTYTESTKLQSEKVSEIDKFTSAEITYQTDVCELEPPPQEDSFEDYAPVNSYESEAKITNAENIKPEPKDEKLTIPKGKIFGFLIKRLRTNNKIMLWAALSEQNATEGDGVLTILAKDENSYRVLSKQENFKVLEEELNALCAYRLTIQKSRGSTDTFEGDAEALKRDFGEDITIIK